MVRPRLAAVLLAAGGSSRLGEPKQLLRDDDGIAAVVRMARALARTCDDVFVVLGAYASDVRAALTAEAVEFVIHDGWRAGMGSSIAAGVRAVTQRPPYADAGIVCGLLIAPCDMPTVTDEHLRQLCLAFDGDVRVASSYATETGEVRGIPALLPRRDWEWLAALAGDQGARPLLRDPSTVTVTLHDGAFDLDTPDDLRRWRQSSSTT